MIAVPKLPITVRRPRRMSSRINRRVWCGLIGTKRSAWRWIALQRRRTKYIVSAVKKRASAPSKTNPKSCAAPTGQRGRDVAGGAAQAVGKIVGLEPQHGEGGGEPLHQAGGGPPLREGLRKSRQDCDALVHEQVDEDRQRRRRDDGRRRRHRERDERRPASSAQDSAVRTIDGERQERSQQHSHADGPHDPENGRDRQEGDGPEGPLLGGCIVGLRGPRPRMDGVQSRLGGRLRHVALGESKKPASLRVLRRVRRLRLVRLGPSCRSIRRARIGLARRRFSRPLAAEDLSLDGRRDVLDSPADFARARLHHLFDPPFGQFGDGGPRRPKEQA
jgi:hypothetical protein